MFEVQGPRLLAGLSRHAPAGGWDRVEGRAGFAGSCRHFDRADLSAQREANRSWHPELVGLRREETGMKEVPHSTRLRRGRSTA